MDVYHFLFMTIVKNTGCFIVESVLVLSSGASKFDNDNFSTVFLTCLVNSLDDFISNVGDGLNITTVLPKSSFPIDHRVVDLTHGYKIVATKVLMEMLFVGS